MEPASGHRPRFRAAVRLTQTGVTDAVAGVSQRPPENAQDAWDPVEIRFSAESQKQVPPSRAGSQGAAVVLTPVPLLSGPR